MTDSMTSTIDSIDCKWTETEAQNLRPGSRFRLVGALGERQHEGEVFTVVNVYEVLTFGPSELSIETASHNFSFKDADIVLTIPAHEKTVMVEGAYFYA